MAMTHVDDLAEFCAGQLDDERARAVQEHLTHCDSCRDRLDKIRELAAEFGELQPQDFARHLTDLENHIDIANIWRLASSVGHELTGAERTELDHVLSCRTCYPEFVHCRAVPKTTVDENDVDFDELAAAALDRFNASRLALGLSFVKRVRNAVEEMCFRVRLAQRLPQMAMLSDAAGPAPTAIEREMGTAWHVERSFGPCTLKLTLKPLDADRQTIDITLVLVRLASSISGADIRAELSTAQDVAPRSLRFETDTISFGALPLQPMHIELIDIPSGDVFGSIDVTAESAD
jgi:hypothetical protein